MEKKKKKKVKDDRSGCLVFFFFFVNIFALLYRYASHNLLWQKFVAGDLPNTGSTGPSPAGTTWNGAIACRRTIAPGGSTTFLFVLAWHFPNRYVNWSQEGFGIHDTKTNFWLVSNMNKTKINKII